MNRIIGTLLVLALISRPEVFKLNYLMLKDKISVPPVEIREKVNGKDIDKLLNTLDNKKRSNKKINDVKNEKIEELNSILSKMAKENIHLDEEEVLEFSNFMEFYEEENEYITNIVDNILNSDLNKIQKELLAENTDLEYLIGELESILLEEEKIENRLNLIINNADNLINTLTKEKELTA